MENKINLCCCKYYEYPQGICSADSDEFKFPKCDKFPDCYFKKLHKANLVIEKIQEMIREKYKSGTSGLIEVTDEFVNEIWEEITDYDGDVYETIT